MLHSIQLKEARCLFFDIRDGGETKIKELGETGAIGIGTNGSRLTVGGGLLLDTGSTLTMNRNPHFLASNAISPSFTPIPV